MEFALEDQLSSLGSSRSGERILNLQQYQEEDCRYVTDSSKKFDCYSLSTWDFCYTVSNLQLDQDEDTRSVIESAPEDPLSSCS